MLDQVPWFAARGAGAVSLLMLTASVCLGLVTVTRFQSAGWPRFFNYELHRRVSLMSIAFLAVHVLAAVLDPFTSLGLGAALVPLVSSYRPIPVALGVIAVYLFVALIATQPAAPAPRPPSLAGDPLDELRDVAAGARPRGHRRHGRRRAVDARDRRRVRRRRRASASRGASFPVARSTRAGTTRLTTGNGG